MNQNIKIRELQMQGHGYKKIAKILGISENTVKSYCRRHPVENSCLQCGRALSHTQGKKRKKFCSDKCRLTWWNSHKEFVKKKTFYTLTCQHCGQLFESYGNSKRKFCSRACFNDSRRKENDNNE
jgi:endogenous inhibitor of DNA gyrase (YacG/DUF329 family)